MITETQQLDNELVPIDANTEEGIAKIEEAKALLPIHYTNLCDSIGGEIGTDLDLDRLPKAIADMTALFQAEAPFLGDVTNVITASLVYANMFGKFRPYIQDSVISKKTNIPANIQVVNIADSGNG